ncbi:MAG: xanthine dehydrogenase family protein molybdopterin-binding subunit [Acidimicrobiales bacterium]
MSRPHTRTPTVTSRSIGTNVLRAEDLRLVSGRGRYLADISFRGEVYAAFVRSPVPHARVIRVMTAVASAIEGVLLIWVGEDVARHCAGIVGEFPVPGCVATTIPLIAAREVRYVGEPVAVVVAEDPYVAEDACDLVEVDYEPLPAVLDPAAAREGGPLANENLVSNVALKGHGRHGDVEEAFATADLVISATFHTGRLSAAPMETRGCVAMYDWSTGSMTVWTPTQMPHYVKSCLVEYLHLEEHLCEVLTPDTGGGFGQKAHIFPEELVVPLLARELDRTVKWVEDRRENLLTATHAHQQEVNIAYALDDSARIRGIRTHALGDGGAYHQPPWSMAVEPWCAVAITPTGIYDIGSAEYSYEAVCTNKCPIGAYRGVGYMAGTLARECLIDDVARELVMSPFEIRRRNVVTDFPWTNPQGVVYDEGSWLDTIDRLEEMVDYPAFLERQQRYRAEQRFLGLGLSIFVESTGEGSATGAAHGIVHVSHDTATVKLLPTGRAIVTIGLTTQGQGQGTTIAQIAADTLGISVDHVQVATAESTRQVHGSGTIGSRSAVVAGGAVLRAAAVIREKLRSIAGEFLEADPHDIELVDGMAFVAGSPATAIPIGQLSAAIYHDDSRWPNEFDPNLEITAAFDPAHPVFSNGGHAVVVQVNVETGFVTLERVYSVEDCGTVVNPAIVEGQIRGGVLQGIGAALYEEFVYDGSGQPLTSTLMDYLLPTVDVAPRFEISHIETPSSHTPGGIKGMGESGLIAAPAAVLNAVNNALEPFGQTLRRLPLTPERVLAAMSQARASI